MKKRLFAILGLLVCGCAALFAEENGADAEAAVATAGALKYIAAAIAVGLACIAGGMAVGKIGAAAMGAMTDGGYLKDGGYMEEDFDDELADMV